MESLTPISKKNAPVSRLLLVALAWYGFLLARQATVNIRRLHAEAMDGNQEARDHFTQTGYARLFGPRNSDLGMVFYALAAISALANLVRRPLILSSLLVGSAASVLVSLYLLWALVFRLRVQCTICIKSHLINFSLLAILLRMRRSCTLALHD